MIRLIPMVALLVLIPLTGCTYKGLFFTEHTHFGLQMKVNPAENKPVDVNMGYDRGIFTLVPKVEKSVEKDGKTILITDAASVISKSNVCVRFASRGIVNNLYASGDAADELSNDPKRVKALFDEQLRCKK